MRKQKDIEEKVQCSEELIAFSEATVKTDKLDGQIISLGRLALENHSGCFRGPEGWHASRDKRLLGDRTSVAIQLSTCQLNAP